MTKIVLNLNLEKRPTATIDPTKSPRNTKERRVPSYVSFIFKVLLIFGEALGNAP